MPHGAHHFDVDKDVPDLSGKVCLVTGANTGLGKQTVLELAKHNPSEIYLTARSADKAKEAINEIQHAVPKSRITFLQLDLNSLASVCTAAKTVLSSSHRLDILILNAGIMCHPPGLTSDGYETQFGTNHLSHALLTKLLLPILTRSPDPRVVILSSDLYSQAPPSGINFTSLKSTQEDLTTFQRYGQSKLANILYSAALARHHPNLTVAAVHPGIFKTNLQTAMSENSALIRVGRRLASTFNLLGDATKGTRSQLWAATAKEVRSGEYYVPVGVGGKAKRWTEDHALVERFWRWTEDELRAWNIEEGE